MPREFQQWARDYTRELERQFAQVISRSNDFLDIPPLIVQDLAGLAWGLADLKPKQIFTGSMLGHDVTISNAIPTGYLWGVWVEVLEVGTGPADFQLGNVSTPNAWGSNIPFIEGHMSTIDDFVDANLSKVTLQDLVITSNGIDFNQEKLRLIVLYTDFKEASDVLSP